MNTDSSHRQAMPVPGPAPEEGPRVLFFSGGTALREVSQVLADQTRNSIHIVTPFDSGGSSAVLRRAFAMPAVGDIRNRLMALADRSATGNSAILELFAHRLPRDRESGELARSLESMVSGGHPLVLAVPEPLRGDIRAHLGFFREAMPGDFDLRGASIGNLVLAGGYLENGRSLGRAIDMFSRLAGVRGKVAPVVEADLHLAAELADGGVVVGQHLITGKQAPPIASPVRRLVLSSSPDRIAPVDVSVGDRVRSLIASADLICYPMGSFYSSLVANLLPGGVCRAVAENDCPKVYIPNAGTDPEQKGMDLCRCVGTLLDYLQSGCEDDVSRDRLLDFVLLDEARAVSLGGAELDRIKDLGVEVLAAPLVRGDSHLLDPDLVSGRLLSLV